MVRIMHGKSVGLANIRLEKGAMAEFLKERREAGEIEPVMIDMLKNEDVNAQEREMLYAFSTTMRKEGEKHEDRAAGFTLS